MIYLLYGPDTYRSRQKLNELVGEYRKKYGTGLDIHRIDAEENDLASLKTILGTDSLFGNKKLAVIENFLVSNVEELLEIISKHKDEEEVSIILWDKGGEEVKLIPFKKIADKAQEFKNLTAVQLRNWISEEATKRGLKLYPAHWARLDNLDGDSWAIINELDKVAVSGSEETSQQARDVFFPREKSVFDLGDSFFIPLGAEGLAVRKKALATLLQLLNQGEDEFGLFAYLVNYTRTLLIVKSSLEKKEPVPVGHKIHPYVVKKATALVRNIPQRWLEDLLVKFFEEDWKIKTGLAKPRESLLALLEYQFCQMRL